MDQELKKVLAEGDIDEFGRTRLINLLEEDARKREEKVHLVDVGFMIEAATIIFSFVSSSCFSTLFSMVVERTSVFYLMAICAIVMYFVPRRILAWIVPYDWECRKKRVSTVFGLVMLICIFVWTNSSDPNSLVANASAGVMCGFCAMHATLWLGSKILRVLCPWDYGRIIY